MLGISKEVQEVNGRGSVGSLGGSRGSAADVRRFWSDMFDSVTKIKHQMREQRHLANRLMGFTVVCHPSVRYLEHLKEVLVGFMVLCCTNCKTI